MTTNKSTVFNTDAGDHTKQPMFLGNALGIQRFDKVAYPIFEKLTQKMLGFYWRPEEVQLQKDRIDFQQKLSVGQRKMFTSNISYQILLDSVQGRGPALTLLPHVSVPELESCIITWDFFETIHSRSYTHIIRSLYSSPSEVFDSIEKNEEIQKRARAVTEQYDKLYSMTQDTENVPTRTMMKQICETIIAIHILEGVRFYVSFACTFAFGELKLLEGVSKIIKLIARDEAQHYAITKHIFNIWSSATQSEWKEVYDEAMRDVAPRLFAEAVQQERDWAKYLFRDTSMIGLNEKLLCEYIEWIGNKRMKAVGLEPIFTNAPKQNPLPWTESWLGSKTVQVAPQETEVDSYLVGSLDVNVSDDLMAGLSI